MKGLVLAGGGVKGSYQIGAYLALKKCGIKIDCVVGTSIGAFNGVMIASGKEKELYEFWKKADIGELLKFDKKYIDSVNKEEKFKSFIYGLEEVKKMLVNKGIDNVEMRKALDEMIDKEALYKSKMDFGLVTVKMPEFKPLYVFKEDMDKDKIVDYILASCNLPVFKTSKFIDDSYYIDGGIYDNNPVNILIDKGYEKIYSIEVHGIGVRRKVKDPSKVVTIEPTRNVGGTLNVNKEKINESIKLGYYDTLKVLKNYDGYNFIFKNRKNWVYNILASRANQALLEKIKKYFKAKTNKEAILKSLEYIMLKEDISYFDIYKPYECIKYTRMELKEKDNFVYEFVRSLTFI